jgi:hypothetical protein
VPDALPAFPGAVGFGAFATGGRGGSVYHVTNLNDSGAGSFRDAVSHSGRTVVFDVGGTIQLSSAVSVASNLTLAGQTAPGAGIALVGREVSFSNSSNDIVRYLRFRQGSLDPDSTKSGINLLNANNLIFDHVSIEFAKWNNVDAVNARNITIQNSILADPIGQRFNAHTETGPFTWYGNLFANAHDRSPLAKANTQFVNNVVYNFQAGYTAGNTSGRFSHDVVNNYFITGPSTTNPGDAFYQMNTNQSVYASGNYEDSNRDGRLNGAPVAPSGVTHLSTPWSPTTSSLPTLSAADAYAADVANAGASLPRDAVDAQVLADVTSLGRAGHLWTSQSQTGLPNNGYGTLANGPTLPDSDGDGLPDGWELYYGLNPALNNANGDFDGTGYRNIEKYINGLADGSYGWVPAPWQFADVGGVGVAGSARYDASAVFTVTGSGAGIGGTNDQFQFVSQPFRGDGALVAQVTSQTNSNGRAEAGLMFRSSSADNAAFAEVDVTPDGHVFFQWRAADGGSSAYATAYAHAPVWVQLARQANHFSAYYSTDGVNWAQVGSTRTLAIPSTSLLGLVVASHDNSALGTATFSGVSVSPGVPVDLSGSFNDVGLVADGTPFSGGLDGNGSAYSANLLGTSVTSGGGTFNLGATGSNNIVRATGQTILLPQGLYSTLTFLATAVHGSQASQTFTVTYTDGTSDTFTQDLSDWQGPQGFAGESVAAALPYDDYADGSSPGTPNYLYQYSFSLNNQKTVRSITLPNNANVVLLALDLLS